MATRVWNGGDGDWSDPAQWTTTSADAPGAPEPGDTATIASGSAEIVGAEGIDGSIFDGVALDIGDAANDPAMLTLSDADLGHFFSIQALGSATIVGAGTSAIAAGITSGGAGTVLTLVGHTGAPNGLLLAHGGSVAVQVGARLRLDGAVTDEAGAGITAAAGSTVVNDGTLKVVGSLVDVGGALDGYGRIRIVDAATLDLGGSVAAGQTIGFRDIDGRLEIADPSAFAGTIRGFRAGDLIDFTGVAATAASYDPASATLTLTDSSGAVLTSLANIYAAPGTLTVTSDGNGGSTFGYAGAMSREQYQIADADRALRSNVVRATTTVPGTATPITGAGVKIGIISTSFDANGTADADAAAGYLPANPDGTSAVQVLSDANGDDEGREMADEVHRIAPGAQIAFAAAGTTSASFEAAVAALTRAGCTIIANDVTELTGPVYQVAGGVDDAVSAAIASGVNVFTSGGNFGQSFLDQTFAAQQTTLPDGSMANAQIFDDGQSSERITVPAGTKSRIDLQWTAPYEGVDDKGAPQALTLEVFAADGTLLGTGSVARPDGVATTDLSYQLPTAAAATDYRVAVLLNGQQVSPAGFKMILSADGTGRNAGGTIDDPAAGQGSGDERGIELVPGVNSVGASYFANSAAFNGTPSYNEYFSSQGPGTLLYGSDGSPLSSPQNAGKIDFDAPDGVYVPDPTQSNPNASPKAFYGTSAAAPDAAAVAALMLQANPNLTTAQVTSLLQQSAINQGLTAAQQGTGLIHADRAVALAIAAIPSAPGDSVSVDPNAAFLGDGAFVLTGEASSPAGVSSVEFTAEVDGVERSIGSATVAADGSFTFVDHVGAHVQGFITATERDGAGGIASVSPPFDLVAGITGQDYVARQDTYTPDGSTYASIAYERADGSRTVDVKAPGQTLFSYYDDTFANGGAPATSFAFTPGYAHDTIAGLRLHGAEHDNVSLPSSDFANFAAVLRDTQNTKAGAVIHDPTSGDTLLLAGVTRPRLSHAASDFIFHA